MRTYVSIVSIVAGIIAAGTSNASAAVVRSLSLNDAVGDPHAVTVAAGQPFTVSVELVADQSFAGYSIYLTDPGYAGTTRFSITNRTTQSANPFTDPNKSDASFKNASIGTTTLDLGYTFDSAAASAGTYDYLMSLTITPSATLTAGPYTIGFNTNSILSNAALTSDLTYTTLTPYTVTVSPAPEPTMAVAIVGMGFIALKRKRESVGLQ